MVNTVSVEVEFRHADLGYRHRTVLKDLSLHIDSDSVTCLLGPNGVGKTTLFRSILGALSPLKGEILLNGKPIAHHRPQDVAKLIAYVPQAHQAAFPFKVLDVVMFGRTAHLNRFQMPGRNDRMVAEMNLDFLDIRHLAERSYTELSGGERQMVLIARALSQEASFLVLDEPTSNLDYGNQCRVLQKIKALREQNIGILMATHSPDHAFMIGTHVIVLKGGHIHKMGPPEQVLTCEVLKRTYGVNVHLLDVPEGHLPSRKICAPSLY